MSELISIIVPIYNVDKYLERCINSIINQTYKNIEIILVDDGSTDSCFDICKQYSEIDSRIIIYKKENGGLSSARNYGFRKSNGKYIIYIDSDDFVSNKYVENLYNAIDTTNSEIAISSFYLVNEDGKLIEKKKKETFEIKTFSNDKALEELLLQKKFDSSAWGKIYLKKFFEKFHYPEGKLYEDLPITYKIFLESNRIAYINSFDYFYVQRENSILNMKFNPKKMDLIKFVDDMFSDLLDKKPHLENYIGTRSFSSLISLWRTIPKDNFYNSIVWSQAMKYKKYPLKLKKSKIKLKLGAVITLFGKDISYKIMSKNI